MITYKKMWESGFLQRKIPHEIKYEHKRRGRQDIILGILRCAKKGSTKYHMMSAARVSFTQCGEYLKYLAWAGYVSEEAGGIWKTTEKGHLVIDACQICHGYLPQFSDSTRARVQAKVKKLNRKGKPTGKAIDRQKGHQTRGVRGGMKQKRR